MAKRKSFSFESNLNKIIPKIEEAPFKVLNIIGQNLIREIKPSVMKRTGKLRKSVGYWARKNEKDLQIGFYNNKHPKHRNAAFYSNIVYNNADPIKPIVVRNGKLIQEMLRLAMNEIGKK